MCPICILTAVMYFLTGVIGFFGFKKIAKWIQTKYSKWSGKRCNKCREKCQ